MPVVIDGTTGITTPSVTNSGASTLSAGTANGVAYLNGSKVLTTGSALVFDGTNLGLGITPSAWGSNYKVVQYYGGAIAGYNNTTMEFYCNSYDSAAGAWKRINAGYATRYATSDGSHYWTTAGNSTAGSAITWTQVMTLNASGNLGLGVTDPTSYGGFQTFEVGAGGNTKGGLIQLRGANSTVVAHQWVDTTSSQYWTGTTTAHPYVFSTNNTERMRITSGGEVYIAGTTDQGAYNLQVNGTGVWGAGAYVNGSDARIKDDIKPLQSSLSVVQNLNPVTFRYKESWSKDTSVQPGFIAQELQQALAGQEYIDGVVMQGPEYMSVAYQTLIPVLTKAIQEQQALIEQLTTRIAALEAK